jgi:hypothetical protein
MRIDYHRMHEMTGIRASGRSNLAAGSWFVIGSSADYGHAPIKLPLRALALIWIKAIRHASRASCHGVG